MPKKDMALSDNMWQYRDVLFDLDTRMLRLAAGESIVERIDNVEDTKGNNGDRGLLRITNLRLIWHAVAVPRINLSIGHNTITGITTRKIRGQAESLYIMSKGLSGTKFEFVFTCVNPSSTKFFSTVIGINRAYEASRMYREMKMRTTLLNSEEKLILLSLETQCDRIDGVWNLSSDQGNLGMMIITNIRVVWHAALNTQSGEYILGFQVKPEERLEHTCKTIQALLNAFQSSPVFGVQYSRQDVGGMVGDVFTEPPSIPQETEEKEPLEKPLRVDAFAVDFFEFLVLKSF
ncbi:unnamed protein product [Meloidogyne enterolobii]|uniref:Uncharacterized protein n=1 Tax=Meloidogyne enterolobii TaxID=390850 RepID=A0ACB1ANJ7_MELEN